MTKLLCWLLVVSALVLQSSCRPQPQRVTSAGLDVPAYLIDPVARQQYIIDHFWDATAAGAADEGQGLERRLFDFCGFIREVDTTQSRAAIYASLDALSQEGQRKALALYKSYLYTPSSPLYNELQYRVVLGWMLHAPIFSAEELEAIRTAREELQRNAVGALAQDFTYRLDSITRRLHPRKIPFTLLLFSATSDSTDAYWRQALAADSLWRQCVAKRQLEVLLLTRAKAPDSLTKAQLPFVSFAQSEDSLLLQGHSYDFTRGAQAYLLDSLGHVLLKKQQLPAIASYLQGQCEPRKFSTNY